MSQKTYDVGDTVIMKTGLARSAAAVRSCRIVGVLPAAERGDTQYRVRFDGENFERRIVGTDIELSEATLPIREDGLDSSVRGGPWLKPLGIKRGR